MIKLFNIILPYLIHINQGSVLSWFGIREENYGIFKSLGINPLQIGSAPAFQLETLQLLLHGIWLELQDGICVADIDRTIMVILIIRFLILNTRYNALTSIIITCIGVVAGYFWYNRFLRLIMTYERGLFMIPYTFKLGIDAKQIKAIIVGTVKFSDYKIRLTNPVGLMMYALGNGAVYNGHRIDPISMLVTKVTTNELNLQHYVESIYYLIYRRIIPYTIRFLKAFHRQFAGITTYTVITRMNKKYCPYLIRWHWTGCLIVSGADRVFTSLFNRIQHYTTFHLLPQYVKAQDWSTGYINLRKIARLRTELLFFNILTIYLVFLALAFTLVLLFHAICGQYAFILILTENIEMHVGPRNKKNIYSGGMTAWQDPKEFGDFKYWYGWFGRGTMNKEDPVPRFKRFILKLILFIYRKLKKIILKIFKMIFFN